VPSQFYLGNKPQAPTGTANHTVRAMRRADMPAGRAFVVIRERRSFGVISHVSPLVYNFLLEVLAASRITFIQISKT
jgi:hypothetical protein